MFHSGITKRKKKMYKLRYNRKRDGLPVVLVYDTEKEAFFWGRTYAPYQYTVEKI